MYDVIVVGARAAGSPTAMLLAQQGYKVLLVDRAHIPGYNPLTNLVQLKGCALLKRWGMLEQVLASNCPPVSQAILQVPPYRLQGEYFPLNEIRATVCPRRTVLDKILVGAALDAGVELREDQIVEGTLTDEERVIGVRMRIKSIHGGKGVRVEEKARLVVGADGKHSLIAKSVQAHEYWVRPALTCTYYAYWEGVEALKGELYFLNREAFGLWPTNDGLTLLFVAYPANEFHDIRENIEARFWETMERIPGMEERLRAGKRVESFYGMADLPAFYRQPYGRGWALVGDAGMTLDPFTGQGIGNAFQDSENLANAVEAGFSGRTTLERSLAEYERKRNADTFPMYEFTERLASFTPLPNELMLLLAALQNKPAGISRLLGALTGSVSLNEFFSPLNLIRILGINGFRRFVSSKLFGQTGMAEKEPGLGSK